MTKAMLRHGGTCRGTIALDITKQFYISTPSFSFSPEGISLGITEISERKDSGGASLVCLKCGTGIDLDNEKSIQAQCMFCRKYRTINSLWVSYPFHCVCDSCKNILSGEQETNDENLLEVMSYYLVPKGSMKFVVLSELLKKPIK